MPIQLLPLTQRLMVADILSHRRARGQAMERVLVADTYVQDCEHWTPAPWGWETVVDGLQIINVDHHAPVRRMERIVSSGNLAVEYVMARGANSADFVLINHCDCDSIISSSLLAGEIAPDDALSEAVIAADHTGVENRIADHLQPLEASRDLQLSQATLKQLIASESVSAQVRVLYDQRVAERQQWARRIDQPGVIDWIGSVALIEADQRIPTELLVGLLPRATLIVTAYPVPQDKLVGSDPDRWIMKVRLGQAAVGQFTLESLGIRRIDPAFGGRWNAGSNNRGGGVSIPPQEYAARLVELVENHV